jgi:hypothetical protein
MNIFMDTKWSNVAPAVKVNNNSDIFISLYKITKIIIPNTPKEVINRIRKLSMYKLCQPIPKRRLNKDELQRFKFVIHKLYLWDKLISRFVISSILKPNLS